MRRIILAGVLLAASSAAGAQTFPTYNIRTHCVGMMHQRNQPNRSVDSVDLATCMNRELTAADDLHDNWETIAPAVRSACALRPPVNVMGRMPGYAEMKSCVDRKLGF